MVCLATLIGCAATASLAQKSESLPVAAESVQERVEPNVPQSVAQNSGTMRRRYSFLIETSCAYASGVCLMHQQDQQISAALFNEFGLNIMTFAYNAATRQTELTTVDYPLWRRRSSRRQLRKDLSNLMQKLTSQTSDATVEVTYVSSQSQTTYRLTPLKQ